MTQILHCEKLKFFQACTKWILGEASGAKVKARPEVLEALREVLSASRDLHLALESGVSLDEVRSKLEKKSVAAEQFKLLTGLTWAL